MMFVRQGTALVLEVRLVAHNKYCWPFLDGPRWREAAARHCECLCYLPQRHPESGHAAISSNKSSLFVCRIGLICSHFNNRWTRAMPKFSGGCLCGAVRYECNAEPLGMAICHCTHCQKVSGSAFSVNIVVPAPSVAWQGQSASYADTGESGKPLSRKFCRNCGSSLATETEALPGAIVIKAGTLDDKSWLKPNYHIWTRSAQPWVQIQSGATTFPKGRT